MIDPTRVAPPPPILRCPTCLTLYAPMMASCSRCKGPLEPAPGPKRADAADVA